MRFLNNKKMCLLCHAYSSSYAPRGIFIAYQAKPFEVNDVHDNDSADNEDDWRVQQKTRDFLRKVIFGRVTFAKALSKMKMNGVTKRAVRPR